MPAKRMYDLGENPVQRPNDVRKVFNVQNVTLLWITKKVALGCVNDEPPLHGTLQDPKIRIHRLLLRAGARYGVRRGGNGPWP